MQLHSLIKSLLLPPASLLIVMLLGVVLQLLRYRRTGFACVSVGLLLLWGLSTPFISRALLDSLAVQYPPLTAEQLRDSKAQAIVILGAGQRHIAEHRVLPQYLSSRLTPRALERAYIGATIQTLLHQQQASEVIPIVVAGGRVFSVEAASEAESMAQVLQRWGGQQVQQEDTSRTTWENAVNVAGLLRQQGVERVLLVTHSWHMSRAVWSFQQQGINAIAVPMGYVAHSPIVNPWLTFVPSADALATSYLALHEQLGMFMYQWRYH